jgi:hypothetical protein
MSSLEKEAQKAFTEKIMNLPPGLQEQFLGTSYQTMVSKAKQEALKAVKLEMMNDRFTIYNQLNLILPEMVTSSDAANFFDTTDEIMNAARRITDSITQELSITGIPTIEEESSDYTRTYEEESDPECEDYF